MGRARGYTVKREFHRYSAKSLDIRKELWYVVVLTRKGDENYGKQKTCG